MNLPAPPLSSLHRRERRDRDTPLPRHELAKLRRWLAFVTADAADDSPAVPDVFDALKIVPPQRREASRQPVRASVLVRRIGACSVGAVEPATLHDVSESGLALRTNGPLERGQRLHVEVGPPRSLPRRLLRRGDRQVHLLLVVRHCRPAGDGSGHIVGCGVGMDFADSLADQMFPPDMPTYRRVA